LRGQTSGPAAPASQAATAPAIQHERLLEAARKEPLLRIHYKTKDGNLLTPEQQADLDRSERLMAEAVELRSKGEFAAALQPAQQALAVRKGLFGNNHHLTISAIAVERTLKRFAAAKDDEQLRLREADGHQARADEFWEKAAYAEAITSARKCLDLREAILGRNHHEMSETLRILGAAQTELLRLDEADATLARASEITEKAFGKRHPQLARVLDRQGWLYITRGQYREAVEALQAAGRIYRTSVGDTVDSAEALDNLGTAVAALGEFNDALKRKLRALVIREALLGQEARDTAVSYSNLAWLYDRMGAKDEVPRLRKRALEIFEKLLGPDHPYTSMESVNLGLAYHERGQPEEAIRLYEQAVAMDDQRTGPAEPKMIDRSNRLAVAYFEAGRRDQALQTLRKGLEKGIAVHRQGSTQAALQEVYQIAGILEHYRLLEEAVKVCEEMRRWDEESSAVADDRSLIRAEQLGNLLVSVGRAAEGKAVLVKAAQAAERLHGKGGKKTGPALLSLAAAYEQLGELQSAEETCDQVVRISETQVGARSKANAYALRAMARIYLLQKRMDLAKFTFEDARKLVEAHQEDDPVEMIRFLQDYAQYQIAAGDRTGAVDTLRDALARSRKLQGQAKSLHMDALLARTLKRLVDALAAAGPTAAAEAEGFRREARALLEKLAAQQAMNGEEKKWLAELGGASAAGNRG
jgi:tetratricopeptide (TPR) repeat protein